MSLTEALSSIYAERNRENRPTDNQNSINSFQTTPSQDEKDPQDVEMVTPLDSTSPYDAPESGLPSQDGVGDIGGDCNCPTTELTKSFIGWLSANADTINKMIDELDLDDDNIHDYEEGDIFDDGGDNDDEFDGADLDFSDLDGGDMKPQENEEVDPRQNPDDLPSEPSTDDPMDFGQEDEFDPSTVNSEDQDGFIRDVENAHLVFKRKTQDGTFEELWFYNKSDDGKSDIEIKNAILSGTDIDPKRLSSEDGTQKYTIWSIGNGQMVHIVGLKN